MTKIVSKRNRKYILICFSLMLTFWLMSIYEYSSILFSGKETPPILPYLGFKFLNHFFTILFVFLLFWPLYYLLAKRKTKRALLIVKIIFVILIIIEFSLTKYSLTTLLNLGADLLGYSLDDIYLTVTSSESTSFLYFVTFLIFPILFWVSTIFLKKATFFKFAGRIFITITLAVLILKFALADFSEPKYQNKTYFFIADVLKYQKEKIDVKSIKLDGNNEYPFLKPSASVNDVLSPLFTKSSSKPNIVFIQVEGLGSEFVGNKQYSGFTPYLNSLISQSLFWPNFLSNAGRTFGALPTITASVPFGEKGFLEIEDTPRHVSIFSVLKKNGYATSFIAGDQSSFDKKINFLEYNGVEYIIDENKYDDSYPKSVNPSNGFSWGYSDYEIFTKALSVIDAIPSPRLDFIATQTIHAPFSFPSKEKYMAKVDSLIKSKVKLNTTYKQIESNKEIFASILYADASIKMFIESYKKRADFKNTIFFITGDHRLIPIAQKDKLCRFNVPFFIYSPMLKEPATMKSINSHADFAPSLLAFLSNSYDVEIPKETAWVGEGIDTSKTFRNIHKVPLMRYKGTISDFVYKDYMYADGTLFKIKEDFNTYKISDKTVLKEITSHLKEFKSLNAYTTQNNKIYPENEDTKITGIYTFTESELAEIEAIVNGLTIDDMFMKAREKAFNNERETARLICNYILKKVPNYVDVRILKGRTLAWDGKYELSEEELLNALKRSPYYDDVYLALLDMYWWSSQNEKSKVIVEKAIKNQIKNDDVAFKMARAYATMNETDKATKIIDSILKKQPKNKVYIKLKNSLQ